MIRSQRVSFGPVLGILCLFHFLAVQVSPAVAAQLFVDPQFGVSTTSNIQYASHPINGGGNLPLTLDLYRPTGPGLPAQLPAIVLMHGGYYASGSKTDSNMVDFAQAFAQRGYVAVSINYRMLGNLPPAPGVPLAPHMDRLPAWVPGQLASWGVTLPQYMNTIAAATYDEAAAVNWLVANAATYDIDPDMLTAGGYSAGAISSLALGAGVVNGVPDVNLKAVFALAGALFGWESVIDASMPGTFLIHGTLDDVVPFSEFPYMQAALNNAGVANGSIVVPGANHTSPLLGSAIVANQQMFFQFMADQFLVPEPTSISLLFVGSIAIVWVWRRRRSRVS